MDWFYEMNGEQQGPIPDHEIHRLISQGIIKNDTLVWRVGLTKWSRADAVPGLLTPPPLPTTRNRKNLSSSPEVPATVTAEVKPSVEAVSATGKWLNTESPASLAAVLLIVGAAVTLIVFIIDIQIVDLLSQAQGSFGDVESRWHDLDAWGNLLGYGSHLFFFPASLAFLFWFKRAHANLPLLGATNLKHANLWSVAGWFVPVMNLYRPCQVANEIWMGSAFASNVESGAYEKESRKTVLGVWWALYLVMSISSFVVFRGYATATTISAFKNVYIAAIVSDVATVLGAISAIEVMRRIQKMQAVARGQVLMQS